MDGDDADYLLGMDQAVDTLSSFFGQGYPEIAG